MPLEYIDEKHFHHTFLQKMFDQPREYALLIQMNFLLQRTLKIKDLVERKQAFLLERSLSEDYLFAQRHFELGHMSQHHFDIYCKFWEYCQSQTPQPCGYIYLYSKDTSFLANRVIQGYREDRRNQELPDDELREFVKDLNKRYSNWYVNLKSDKISVEIFKDDFNNCGQSARVFDFVHKYLK
jgi:deoxyadenosine/deoxycytidine kinase